jgi:putative ABC transport system permease protein
MTTLKHILRRLGNFPVFTAITIATLAIGIGANGAIFAVIENVLLKPLPFPDSAQLVDLGHDLPGIGLHGRSAPFLYFIYGEQSRSNPWGCGGRIPITSPASPNRNTCAASR